MTNISDVAKAAGVSRGTVSNYLNHRKIRAASVSKIERAIEELHYVPNIAAREFRQQHSHYVIFILPTVWTPFFAELTHWIQLALVRQQYKVILCLSNNEYEKEREYLAMAAQQKASGIISISHSNLNEHVSASIPMVSIEKEETGKFPLVSSDNYLGGRLAAQALMERDRNQLLFVGEEGETSQAMLQRQRGFVDFCVERKLSYQVITVPHLSVGNNQTQAVLEKLRKVFSTIDFMGLQVGIMNCTDEYALLTLRVLEQLDIQVPAVAQVVGFDGSKLNERDIGYLSSIRQPVQEIAITAVDLLVKLMRETKMEPEKARIFLPVSFHAGQTTLNPK